MKHTLLFLICLLAFQASAQSLWQEIKLDDVEVRGTQETRVLPHEFKAYKLNYDRIKKEAFSAPSEQLSLNIQSDVLISLPLPDGSLEEFSVYESLTMQDGISAKYPNIKSFKGISVNNPLVSVRFDFGANGFHAAVKTPEKVYYIDPYASDDLKHYLTYDVKKDVNLMPEGIPRCGTDHSQLQPTALKPKNNKRADIIPLRTYRLAISCTGEYGQWKGSVEKAMSDFNTSVNRINQVFENEAAIRFVIVDDNDLLLNFDPAADPFTDSSNGGLMLSQNTANINNIIGFGAYDIGHVYGRGCNTGGIAALGSHCQFNKGAGVTCNWGGGIDAVAVGTTAHEFGHQLSANHTFNHCDMENENLGTGVEPGSGGTIMSYAGGCGPQNVQGGEFDHFQTQSLKEMYNHSRDGAGSECGEIESFGNHEPVITLPELYNSGLVIPEYTPFYLEGSATDEDGDILTYVWDPANTGPLSNLGDPLGEAPHFMSFQANSKPGRMFPREQAVFNNQNFNTEVLPKGGLTMLFNFTVRDNNPNGGTAVWEEVKFKTAATDGKFEITNFDDSGLSLDIGDEVELTWNVAGTDQSPINTTTVDIYFSSTSLAGFDYNNLIPLAQCVPNNGSAMVRLPNVETNQGRFVIKAVDNIYFDISNRGFQVLAPEEPALFATVSQLCQQVCVPTTTTLDITTAAFNTNTDEITLSMEGLPAGTIVTFADETLAPGESTTATLDFSDVLLTEVINPRLVLSSDSIDTPYSTPILLDIVASDHSDMLPTEPVNGSSAQSVGPTFKWIASAYGDSYDFELSDSPTFDNIIMSEYGIAAPEFPSSIILDKRALYYWRIRANNRCGSSEWSKTQGFSTAILACEVLEATNLPINITQSGTQTVEADFNSFAQGTIADVNVKTIKGDHSLNKDLVGSIVSPTGTEVILFSKICPQQDLDVTFDDEANVPVKCPLGKGETYRPRDPLSVLNGEETQGVWKLRIADTKAGNGGQLQEAVLELCANVSVANPVLQNLSVLEAGLNGDNFIGSWIMSVSDDESTPEELTYTVVAVPTVGAIYQGSNYLRVGEQFTQDDINKVSVYYQSTDQEGTFGASFAVEDGDGGWVGILDLPIIVSGDFSTNAEDLDITGQINIYPNPASSVVTIGTGGLSFDQVQLVDIQGRVMATYRAVADGKTININELQNGVYLLQGNNESGSFTKKVIVQK